MRKFTATDAVVLIGLGLIVYGVSMVHVPTAVILGGVLLTAIGYLASVPVRN
jgi:hypothetical protein